MIIAYNRAKVAAYRITGRTRSGQTLPRTSRSSPSIGRIVKDRTAAASLGQLTNDPQSYPRRARSSLGSIGGHRVESHPFIVDSGARLLDMQPKPVLGSNKWSQMNRSVNDLSLTRAASPSNLSRSQGTSASHIQIE